MCHRHAYVYMQAHWLLPPFHSLRFRNYPPVQLLSSDKEISTTKLAASWHPRVVSSSSAEAGKGHKCSSQKWYLRQRWQHLSPFRITPCGGFTIKISYTTLVFLPLISKLYSDALIPFSKAKASSHSLIHKRTF